MSDPAIAAAEWREVSERRLSPGNLRTYPLAPFLEDSALKRYVYFKNRYQSLKELDGDGDLPATFEQTSYCQQMVAAHGSARAARAVRRGQLPVLSFLTGLTHRGGDFSSAQQLQQLLNSLRRDGFLATFLGNTDGGKTNTALLMAGLAMRDNPEMQLATNVTTVEWQSPELQQRTHEVESKSELLALVENHEDVIAVLDEMSTQANAQTNNYEVNSEFYEVITFKSKYGLRLICIGHRDDGHDIAPAIREHSTYIVRQVRETDDYGDDEYHAELYGSVEDGELVDHEMTLENVPQVRAAYDPDETATFEISS